MDILTKLALGFLGQLGPRPASGETLAVVELPAPARHGGLPLMKALAARQSAREFEPVGLAPQALSDLLWAAAGINRADNGGRTFPSAMNAQEIDVYVATAEGLYRYEAGHHRLEQVAAADVRRVTGYQDFVDTAALDLVYVADHRRMKLVPAAQRERYAFAAAGAIAQNVYLFCASAGLASVVRAWFDKDALARAMNLGHDEQLLLSQTVGQPRRAK